MTDNTENVTIDTTTVTTVTEPPKPEATLDDVLKSVNALKNSIGFLGRQENVPIEKLDELKNWTANVETKLSEVVTKVETSYVSELNSLKMDMAKKDAMVKYGLAESDFDLISATSPDDLAKKAEALSERLKTAAPVPAPTPKLPTYSGSATAVPDAKALMEEYKAQLRKGG